MNSTGVGDTPIRELTFRMADHKSVAAVGTAAVCELMRWAELLLTLPVNIPVVAKLPNVVSIGHALFVGVASVKKLAHGLSSGSGRRPRSMASGELRSTIMRSERSVAVATDIYRTNAEAVMFNPLQK